MFNFWRNQTQADQVVAARRLHEEWFHTCVAFIFQIIAVLFELAFVDQVQSNIVKFHSPFGANSTVGSKMSLQYEMISGDWRLKSDIRNQSLEY